MEENPVKFFTATINSWKHLLMPDKYKQLITESLKFLVEDKRVWIFGFVVMPNHIHLLWRMRSGIAEKDVHRDFLKFTSQKIKSDLEKHHPKVLDHFKSTQSDRKYQFWQRRPYSSEMHNREVVEQKLVQPLRLVKIQAANRTTLELKLCMDRYSTMNSSPFNHTTI